MKLFDNTKKVEIKHDCTAIFSMREDSFHLYLYEPHYEKTCLRGLRPGKTQTGLLSYRDELES